MARSGPKCFLAAWEMAFCRVSTRTLRSMPLSFATWSRIMFRLSVGTTCCAGAAMVLLRVVFSRARIRARCALVLLSFVVPVDEGGALASEEVVLERAGRVLAGDRTGGGALVLLAVREREGEARVLAARVPRAPGAEARLALAAGEEQNRLAAAEQPREGSIFAPHGHLGPVGLARVLQRAPHVVPTSREHVPAVDLQARLRLLPLGGGEVFRARLDVGLGDLLEGDAEELPVHVDQRAPLLEPAERPREGLAVLGFRDGAVRLHAHVLARVLAEMLRGAQRPVETRARHLQVVRALDGVLDVEGGGHGARDAAAIVEGDPAVPVDEQAQGGAAAGPCELDVDQLEPFAGGEGRRDGAHLLDDLLLATHLELRPPKNKKSGQTVPTFPNPPGGGHSENVSRRVADRIRAVKPGQRAGSGL